VLAVDKSTFNGNLAGIAGGGLANNTPYPPEEEEPPSSLFAGQNAVEAEEGVNVVENSTFTDNLARLLFGGGILTGGAQLDLVNDTIAANAMASTLLGQLVGPEAENDFLTFNGGRGAGLYATGPVTAKNTILASNIDDGRASNCWDFAGEGGYWVESLGNNILSDDVPDDYPGDEWCRGFSEESGDQIGVDPLLDDLHENGGPTETMALLPGSPALDSAADCPATDQRGGHRPPAPGSAGPECDIGAYEAYSLGDLSVAANVAGGDPSTVGDKLTYTLVVTNDGPDTARSVSLANALPAGVDFLAAPAGCTQIGQAVTCDLGTLDPDQVKIVKIDVRPTAAGTLVDTATISAPGYTDTDSANDSAAVTSGVLPRQSTPEVPDAPDEPDEQLPPLKMKVDAPKEITVDEFLDGFLVSADCVGEECQRNFRSHVKIKTGAARIAAFNLTVARVSVGSKYKGRVRLRPCVTGTSVASAQRPNRSCLRQLSRHARKFAPFKVKVVFAGYKKDGRVTYKKRFVKVKKG
jgi:uncharacterized repeat protein (TIGR01451 family)